MSTPPDENRDERADAAGRPVPSDGAAHDDAATDAAGRSTPPGDVVPDDELAQTAVLDDVRRTEVIEPLPGDEAATVAGEAPRRRRRAAPWIIALVCAVALVAVLVVADLVTRSLIERGIADQVEQNLPEGVDGDVSAHLGGFSVLAQLVSGSLTQVDLDAPELEVGGNPLDVHVAALGVPVQQGGTIDRVTGTVDIDEVSVNALVDVPGAAGAIALGDGTLGYTTSFEVLGLELSASITASAEAAGTSVLLTPVGVELSSGGNDLDLSGLADRLLGDAQVEVCVAQYLPEGLLVDDITLTEGRARVAFEATDVLFDEQALRTLGTCDAS